MLLLPPVISAISLALCPESDTIPDRREAVRNLTDEGHSAREIADIVGVSHDTTARDVRNLTPDQRDYAERVENGSASTTWKTWAASPAGRPKIGLENNPIADGPTQRELAAWCNLSATSGPFCR